MTEKYMTDEEAIAAYFAAGGEVTVCSAYERTDPEEITQQWGKKRKPERKAK